MVINVLSGTFFLSTTGKHKLLIKKCPKFLEKVLFFVRKLRARLRI